MRYRRSLASGWLCCVLALHPAVALACDDSPSTARSSEQRFPPLKLPPGFRATLFACDPMVAYPSAIAAGPRDGSIFVAVDSCAVWGQKSRVATKFDSSRMSTETDMPRECRSMPAASIRSRASPFTMGGFL